MPVTLQPVAVCPECQGTGREFSLKHHGFARCGLCEERGWVPIDACKGCGRPAAQYWPEDQEPILKYCGRKECLAVLVVKHRVGESVGTYHPQCELLPAGDEDDEIAATYM